MTDIVVEEASDNQLTLIDKLELVDQVGQYHIKGYNVTEIASLMDLERGDIRTYIE